MFHLKPVIHKRLAELLSESFHVVYQYAEKLFNRYRSSKKNLWRFFLEIIENELRD